MANSYPGDDDVTTGLDNNAQNLVIGANTANATSTIRHGRAITSMARSSNVTLYNRA